MAWHPCGMVSVVHIYQEHCLNKISETDSSTCKRCTRVCPSNAIKFDSETLPQLDASSCTACTACVSICPSDAIQYDKTGYELTHPVALLNKARKMVSEGQTEINATCSAASAQNGLKIACHATWEPMLLACMAAEGVRTLHLEGLQQCDSCPVRHGAHILQKTETDYATLNTALGVKLAIVKEEKTVFAEETAPKSAPEPERRAFFRNLIPSITKGAAVAAAQVGYAASQAIRQEMQGKSEHSPDASPLPVRLRLFLRALPRLQANFTPLPAMQSLPLGAIQADDNCTACATCVEQCPTRALSIREFGSNAILEFQPDACIGCEQCIAVCPEHALEKLPGISLPALLTGRKRPLVMVSVDASSSK